MIKYELSQEKLDVINKTRSNIFDWRGQFTPELIAGQKPLKASRLIF